MGRHRIVREADEFAQSVEQTSENQEYNVPAKEYEPSVGINKKQMDNVIFVKPLMSLKVKTTTPLREDRIKERNYMHERVVGVFENRELIGEAKPFWINAFPGDDYEQWILPTNVPISIPRYIAKHLNENTKYTVFKYKEKSADQQVPNSFKEGFEPSHKVSRMTFALAGQY